MSFKIPNDFFLISGPCVVEDKYIMDEIAAQLCEIGDQLKCRVILKASFDKANRTSSKSYRGPGMENGLEILKAAGDKYNLPITSDIHEADQAEMAAQYLDIIQIPSLLSRQTSLIEAAARTGKVVNIKKGQFLSGNDMAHAAQKAEKMLPKNISATENIMLTERGNIFGYNNITADMRNIVDMQKTGFTTIFDASHTAQHPGNGTDSSVSGGQREMTPILARAAMAAGANGLFIETHPQPDKALSDKATVYPLDQMQPLIQKCQAIYRLIRE